eukprot:s1247_g8.t1
MVRALKAELTPGLQNYADHAFGWNKEGERWIGVHLSAHYQNPLFIPNVDYGIEWFRTTVIKKDQQWIMVEYCEKVSEMIDVDKYIEETPGRTTIITFLTDGFEDVEEMGFSVEGGVDRERMEALEMEIQPMLDIPEDTELEQRELAEFELHHGPQGPADGAQGDDLAAHVHAEQPFQLQVPQEGQIIVGEILPTQIEVDGQVLTQTNSLATLRAACGFYKISRSGSKAKCYRRLCQHQKTLELLAAQAAIAHQEGVVERHPNVQNMARPPSQAEQELHALTHTPYAAWCSSCIKHRARPDQHRRTGAAHNTPIPVISMDFCVTKKKDGLDPNPEGSQDDKGALWLVLTDSQTGYLGVIPIQAKSQLNYMTHEVLSFVQSLGYAEVGFYGDNEPTIRQILKTIITARHALGMKTRIYTTKLKDSAGNALVENSIQRVRQLACTLVDDVSQKTGLVFPCEHALWSWAGRHAAWCLNRFQVGRDLTSFEVTQGKKYDGKVANFAEPVYGYCKPRGKADAKWRVGLFLGKTEAQDAWIIGDGVDVMLTRSIRRVDQPWTRFLAYFTGLQTHSFIYQTNFGGRIVPTKRKIAPQRQEGKLLPRMTDVERRFADEEAQAVMAYANSREGRLEAQKEVQEALASLPSVPPEGAAVHVEDAIPEVPQQTEGALTSSASQPVNADLLASPSSPRASALREPERSEVEIQEEPSSKRSKHEGVVRRIAMIERRLVEVDVGGETFYHLDNVIDEDTMNLWEADEDDEMRGNFSAVVDELEKLWSDEPLTRAPPEPDPEVDRLADSVEVKRLQEMGVLEGLTGEDANLELLTTRMVYDWRIKEWRNSLTGEQKRRWMRRARLVAREYANCKRDDVHSPASGGQVLRLLPAIYLMMIGVDEVPPEEVQIGSLDIKDAFLMADQEQPVQIATKVGRFKVLKNLPGQRLAARAWYDFLASFLVKKGIEFSKENPCLGKRGGGLFLLLHVDDVMFCGLKDEVNKLIAELKTAFTISHKVAQYPGDQFEFLRRTYVLREDGLDIMPGRYAENMIEAFESKYGPVKLQHVPCGDDAQEISTSSLLPADEASLFRSLVGSGIYLAQERIELGFVIKQLASGMSNPSRGHLAVMKKLIGYLKKTLGNYSHLNLPSYGKGIHNFYDAKFILESFTDADWSGDRVSRRSTSSSVHCLNGIVLHYSSRGQRVVSLSSAESELHGLVSGAADGMALRLCIEFLMDVKVQHVCLVDNSATRQISNKKGSGRLRHVSGKLLWIQDQTSSGILDVKQVSTTFNVGDIGTKPLSKQRLYALMCWCNIHDKDNNCIGEEEAARLKETHISKGKIMRVAKVLQTMILFGGLEQATGELIPFRMDLETVIAPEPMVWISLSYPIVLLFVFMVVGFIYLYVIHMKLYRSFLELRGEHQQLRVAHQQTSNELSMQYVYVTAIHVGLIRNGGFVNPNVQNTAQDWDNWHYVERVNKRDDSRRCRRSLKEMRKAGKKKRRHVTPGRTGDDENEEFEEDEEMSEESPAARRRRYMQSTLSECSDPDEWCNMHYGSGEEPNDDGEEPHGEEEGEESESEEKESEVSDVDTIYSEYLKDEHIEYPSYDFAGSHDRAQLVAYEKIFEFARRKVKAIKDSHERLCPNLRAPKPDGRRESTQFSDASRFLRSKAHPGNDLTSEKRGKSG